jgi:hypothetical protein
MDARAAVEIRTPDAVDARAGKGMIPDLTPDFNGELLKEMELCEGG